MGKNLGEIMNYIMEKNATKKVLVMTENLHIVGTIHGYEGDCKSCHDCLISLKDVKISRVGELSRCAENECNCNDAFAQYRWFNISTNAIVGFSILNSDE